MAFSDLQKKFLKPNSDKAFSDFSVYFTTGLMYG